MIIDLLLYSLTTLIWGSTWLAVHWQLGVVSPYWSLTYRFALATLMMMLYCVVTQKPMRFPWPQQAALMVQGVLLFGLNYLLYYLGSQYFVSGLVAVISATIIVMNIINSRIFFKTPLQLPVVLGAVFGLVGLSIIFYGQFQQAVHQASSHHLWIGLSLCLLATLSASLGNMMFVYNQRFQIPVLQSNAYGLLYGTVLFLSIAVLSHVPITFDLHPRYWLTLLYLVLFGTIIAFATYLQLVKRMGAERASYALVLLPVISLILSHVFEDFHWSGETLIGLAIVVFGNVLVIKRKAFFKGFSSDPIDKNP